MKFIEVKDLEIVNCNYLKLKEKRASIEEKNKKIKAENRKRSSSTALSVAIFTLTMLGTTGLLMWVMWDRLLRGVENTALFAQYEMLNPMAFKVMVEIIIVVLCGALYSTGLTLMFANKQVNKTPLLPYGDDILLASVLENRIVGNLNIECGGTNVPYISRSATFSLDTIDAAETNALTFKSSEKQWVVVLLPGLFKTIIDVGGRIIYRPYADENEVVDSVENAYIHEKMQKRVLEEKFFLLQEKYDQDTKKSREQLNLSKKEIVILETNLQEARRALENIRTEKERSEEALREAQRRLAASDNDRELELREQQKTADETNRNFIFLQQSYNGLKDNYEELKLQYNKKVEENKSLSEQIYMSEAAIRDYEHKFETIEADYQKQLKDKDDECHFAIVKMQDEVANSPALKDAEQKMAALKVQIATLTQKNQKLSKSNEENLHVIQQLQHNAKADREHYQNIENEYNLVLNTSKTLQKELDAYRIKEKQWIADKEAIDIQKKAMLDRDEQIKLLTKHKETLEKGLLAAKADNDKLIGEIQYKDQKIISLEQSAKENQGQEEKIGILTEENKSLQQGSRDLKTRNKKLSDENKALNGQIQKLNEEYASAKEAHHKSAADLINLQQKNNSLQEYVTSLQFQLNEAQAENKQLTSQLEKANKDKETLRNNHRVAEDQSANFSRLMKEREERLRKAREDARLAAEKDSSANAPAE